MGAVCSLQQVAQGAQNRGKGQCLAMAGQCLKGKAAEVQVAWVCTRVAKQFLAKQSVTVTKGDLPQAHQRWETCIVPDKII